jgi:hypothetical protein
MRSSQKMFHVSWYYTGRGSVLTGFKVKALLDKKADILLARNLGTYWTEYDYKNETEALKAVAQLPDWNKSQYVYFYNGKWNDVFDCAASSILSGEPAKKVASQINRTIFHALSEHSSGKIDLFYFQAHEYKKETNSSLIVKNPPVPLIQKGLGVYKFSCIGKRGEEGHIFSRNRFLHRQELNKGP